MVETRPATLADLDAIVDLHTRARTAYYAAGGAPPNEIDPADYDHADRRADWAAAITGQRVRVRCAVADGQVVGVVAMGTPREPTDERVGVLFQIHVLPARWHQGIGTRLHADFVAYLRAENLTVARLEAWAANARANAFYAHHGWRPDGTGRPGPAGIDYRNLRLAPSRP
jgi:ribosomal protein S18 acetylase RimI-like enzyme